MHPDFLFQLYHLPQKGISEEAGLEGDGSISYLLSLSIQLILKFSKQLNILWLQE